MKLRIALLVYLLLFVPFSVYVKEQVRAKGISSAPIETGTKVGDFTLPNVEGEEQSFEELSVGKKVVLLHFWATWCGPCRIETPELVRIHQEYADRGFEIIAVSSDRNRMQVERFMKQYSIPYPVLFDPTSSLMNQYGISALPTSVLIKDGIVKRSFSGVEPSLEREVVEWLKR